MSETMAKPTCCVPGCDSLANRGPADDADNMLCEDHFQLASVALRERFVQLCNRQALLESYWDDEAKYDAVVASDRYLKLANATGWATELTEDLWNRLKLDVAIRTAARKGAPQETRKAS